MTSTPAESLTFVVAFDVVEDARRSRLSAFLESRGHRVQKSVFELVCTWPRIRAVLEDACREDRFDPETDSLRCYPLCTPCRSGVILRGTGSTLAAPSAPMVF